MTLKLDCEDLVRYLSDYIDNNLDEELAAAAREHLETCENCSVVLDSTQKMIVLYRQHGRAKKQPFARQRHLYEQLVEAFAARTSDEEK